MTRKKGRREAIAVAGYRGAAGEEAFLAQFVTKFRVFESFLGGREYFPAVSACFTFAAQPHSPTCNLVMRPKVEPYRRSFRSQSSCRTD